MALLPSEQVKTLGDQQKSAMLAEAMGWFVVTDVHRSDNAAVGEYRVSRVHDAIGRPIDWPDGNSSIEWVTFGPPDLSRFNLNLYDPAQMALAGRVVDWINRCLKIIHVVHHEPNEDGDTFTEKTVADCFRDFWMTPQAKVGLGDGRAQRAWMDKALELMMIAGRVDPA